MLARLEDSVLVVIDVQPSVFDLVQNRDQVLQRCRFMAQCARALGVPVLLSEQNPDKLGNTEASLAADLPGVAPNSKMAFSCWGEPKFVQAFNKLQRPQAVVIGIETHICVNQTVHDLMDEDIDVIVCADAVSARTQAAHEGALKRMADEGAAVAHTESVVYEWMKTAKHPAFREVLQLVKTYS